MSHSLKIFVLVCAFTAHALSYPPPNLPTFGYTNGQLTQDHIQNIYQSINRKGGSDSKYPIKIVPITNEPDKYTSSQTESQPNLSNEMERFDNLSVSLSLNETKGNSTGDNSTLPDNHGDSEVSSIKSESNSTDKDVAVVTEPTVEQSTHSYSAFYNKTLIWLSDAYTLSILVPVASGFVIAAVVIVLVAFCNCIRRRCCGRRLRRKTLTDAIRSMNSADRAKLLAESSDEEF